MCLTWPCFHYFQGLEEAILKENRLENVSEPSKYHTSEEMWLTGQLTPTSKPVSHIETLALLACVRKPCPQGKLRLLPGMLAGASMQARACDGDFKSAPHPLLYLFCEGISRFKHSFDRFKLLNHPIYSKIKVCLSSLRPWAFKGFLVLILWDFCSLWIPKHLWNEIKWL